MHLSVYHFIHGHRYFFFRSTPDENVNTSEQSSVGTLTRFPMYKLLIPDSDALPDTVVVSSFRDQFLSGIRSAFILLFCLATCGVADLRRCAPPRQGTPPETINVWVYFTGKPGASQASLRTLGKRPVWTSATALPVSSGYIRQVQAAGGVLRHCFKWDNAASFRIPVTALPAIRLLPCVEQVTLVGRKRLSVQRSVRGLARREARAQTATCGAATRQLAMLRIPEAHRYLSYVKPAAEPGQGVRIAFFDSGFRLDHRCFSHLHKQHRIIAAYDFIDNDTTVADPDSVAHNSRHPLWGNDFHGTEVLSTVAALDTPWYCGAAWGAEFLLARTEDAYYDSISGLEHELHLEEDNWAAAVVWAESLGVDIISSSLGYRYDFQDTVIIDRGDGTTDTIVDYLKSDLDGKTTVVSRAARYAVDRGIIVVNSAGNEQNDGDTSLSAPADVDGVIAVGAVNYDGSLAWFSSFGPSADGRLKPDLVAPGSSIALPDVLRPTIADYSQTSSGTSFATPLVAGVCALLRQAHPSMTAAQLRERLYICCRLLPAQTAPNNYYGRGLPDAVRSCMAGNQEVFLAAMDTGGIPLNGVTVVTPEGDTVGTTSADGILRLTVDSTITALWFTSENRERRVAAESLPWFSVISPCSLTVKVVDESSKPIAAATAAVYAASSAWVEYGDSLGEVSVNSFFPQPVSLIVSKIGYSPSDTTRVIISEVSSQRLVVLHGATRPRFEVYPTVVRRRRDDRLLIRFAPREGILEQYIHISIRSLSGALVWQSDAVSSEGAPVDLQWQARTNGGSRIAPGTYFVLLACEGKQYRKPFIIAE